MTKTKRNIKKLVKLTNRLKEMEIVHEQLRDIAENYINEEYVIYHTQLNNFSSVLDDMVDKAKKAVRMIEDEIIEIETELGF